MRKWLDLLESRFVVREGHFGKILEGVGLKPVQTILVIDDEVDLANTCVRFLKGKGFECKVAYTMEDAFALFDAGHFSLVLSDITLPTGDGFEIARYVHDKSPDIPVILMTAYHSATSPEEAQRAGASHYLRKPFSNSDLLAVVQSLLNQEA